MRTSGHTSHTTVDMACMSHCPCPAPQSISWTTNASQTLNPGDSLITTCAYNSSSRAKNTTWGEETQDEMCFNFLLYYPAYPGLDVCLTTAGGRSFGLCSTWGKVMGVTSVLERGLGAGLSGGGLPAGMNQTALAALVGDTFQPAKNASFTPYAGPAQCTKGAAASPDAGAGSNGGSNSSAMNSTSSRNDAAGLRAAGAAWLLAAAAAAGML
jgi:hypothetical protein